MIDCRIEERKIILTGESDRGRGYLSTVVASFFGETLEFKISSSTPVAKPEILILIPYLYAKMAGLDGDFKSKFDYTGEKQLKNWMDVFHSWNPDYDNSVRLPNRVGKPECDPSDMADIGFYGSIYSLDLTGIAFSGGVDSLYSVCKHGPDLSTVLFCMRGFDGYTTDEEWECNQSKRVATAISMGCRYATVDTNLRPVLEKLGLPWRPIHGSVLAGFGIAMNYKKTIIPSSFTYDSLIPWGSHPLLETQLGTSINHVTHDGCESPRRAKIKELSKNAALNHVQVCWENTTMNCGRCGKCIRTLLLFKMMGIEQDAIPDTLDFNDQLKILKSLGYGSGYTLDDLIKCAHENAESNQIAKTLLPLLTKTYKKNALKNKAMDFLKEAAGVKVLDWFRRRGKEDWRKYNKRTLLVPLKKQWE